MKTSKEIKQLVKNLKYYSSRIYELAKKDFEEDLNNGLDNASIVDTYGMIGNATNTISNLLDGIEFNINLIENRIKKNE